MIQNVLSHISGIEIYGIVSICLFFATFLGIVVWAFGLKKSYLNAMRELPLVEDDPTATPAPRAVASSFRHE